MRRCSSRRGWRTVDDPALSSKFTRELVAPVIRDDVLKLDPRTLYKNPVIFVTGIVAALSTLAARNKSAILLAIIFIPRIIPALKTVKYRPARRGCGRTGLSRKIA